MLKKLTQFSIHHPKIIMVLTLIAIILTGLQFSKIKIDTDPENMLSEKEFVRYFHHEVKKEFSLNDFIVFGIVNETHENGVFNVDTLTKIHKITEQIKKIDGVIAYDVISPSTTDNIQQAGLGTVRFEWLMKQPPTTENDALAIMRKAKDNPLLDGTMISEDGKALCIYIPIKAKNMSYRIYQEALSITQQFTGNEAYYITGLPVAEDTFGFEMFKQMATSAPLAGLIIFLLMWVFFRKIKLILSPMIVAITTVICTMGLLIGKGFTVHIMSSMIPIFLMPIAVVDSIHILSEFFDTYKILGDKKQAITQVMEHLSTSMLFTSLTTTVGFASLIFTPIPPVQVFGAFVGIGVMIAWLLTVTFVPAFTVLIKDSYLQSIHIKHSKQQSLNSFSILHTIRNISLKYWKIVLILVSIILMISIYGISKININDNPVKWFTKKHPIRVADKVLNTHFGGTYTSYLVLNGGKSNVFKEPEMLRYIEKLQEHLLSTKIVGKSTSLTNVVKKIYYELMDGDKSYNKVPDTSRAVAQCLLSFQNSHKPDDLWHLTTPDYSKVNIWVQLTSGDNKDMSYVVEEVNKFFLKNTPPFPITYNWAGLTYINTIWQKKMVTGMLKALLGSFIIVLLMMIFLFKSPIYGLLSMIPLSITILFIYGLIGLIGKDYDMPIAVLSSLTLGLSVDFSIHFLQRMRTLYEKFGSWQQTATHMFEEPARAISKNAVIISIGFLPLVLSSLIPYKTVGFFLAAIMGISSLATLILLPSIVSGMKKQVFKEKERKGCNCFSCLILSISIASAVVFFLHEFSLTNWNITSIIALIIVIITLVICNRLSQQTSCKQ